MCVCVCSFFPRNVFRCGGDAAAAAEADGGRSLCAPQSGGTSDPTVPELCRDYPPLSSVAADAAAAGDLWQEVIDEKQSN